MKKLLILAVCAVVSGLCMTSCGNTRECPAYGQVQTNVVEINIA